MADPCIAPHQRPAHLESLYQEAVAEAERTRGILHTPSDDALVSTIYQSLRVRAYQRELEPFTRQAARLAARSLWPSAAALDRAHRLLDDVAATLRRRYDLE
jgi:hypothetical protein